MSFIDIISETWVHHQDSAFPTIVTLDSGRLICGFNVGGGPEATGGTEWAFSDDKGVSWQYGGVILPKQENPLRANCLRLSRTADNSIIAYGQRSYPQNGIFTFGSMKIEAVLSTASGSDMQWGVPDIIGFSRDVALEISNPVVVLKDGRWLAPAAFLTDKEHLGEKVVVRESSDAGASWPNEFTVFQDPAGKKGFFEVKIIETTPGNLLAFAWTVELGSYKDFCNHYVTSNDGGRSWSQPQPTTINGQTLTPLWLGEDNFLLIYNYRQAPQGIKVARAKIDETGCKIIEEQYLWQPQRPTEATDRVIENGIDTFDDFKFGLPSITSLDNGKFLAVFWCFADGDYGIKAITFA